MKTMKIEDVKRGEFIKCKPDAKKVYRKAEYDRSQRKYCCDDWDDISREITLKRGTIVYVGFDF